MVPWPGLSARVITAVLWRLREALHGNNDLSLSVSFSQVPESVGDIAQLIAPVDDRCHLSALEKLPHDLQVLSVRLCHEEDDLLATRPTYGVPVIPYQSAGFTEAAWTRTSTPSSSSSGFATSCSSRTSGDPNVLRTIALTGLAAVDGQDDVPGLLLRFDVPGRFDDLLQRVGPIDDRPILPGFDELLQEEDVLLSVPRYPERHLLVADPTGQQSQHRDVPHEPEVG